MASLTRWHINDNGVVGKCSATRAKCPFGGESGTDNHFSSQEAAELYLAKGNKSFSAMGTKRKRPRVAIGRVKPETRDSVESLVDAGMKVAAPKNVNEPSTASPNTSNIDILDESVGKISLDAIRKNRPF